jgi:predicted O-methyltransferase YrrM
MLVSMLRHRSFAKGVTPSMLKECFIPLTREGGELLYLTARAINAKTIVEFGTSFAISTLYLAAAVRDNGGGQVIGTELEPEKHAARDSAGSVRGIHRTHPHAGAGCWP